MPTSLGGIGLLVGSPASCRLEEERSVKGEVGDWGIGGTGDLEGDCGTVGLVDKGTRPYPPLSPSLSDLAAVACLLLMAITARVDNRKKDSTISVKLDNRFIFSSPFYVLSGVITSSMKKIEEWLTTKHIC